MIKKTFKISGMHCPSCEQLLEEELGRLEGVKKVEANCRRGEIVVEQDKEDFSAIKQTIEKFDYKVCPVESSDKDAEKNENTSFEQWLMAIGVVILLLFFYRFFQAQGILSGFSLGNKAVSYGLAFLIGLVASVSSCLAVVGGMVIAFAEKYETKEKDFFRGTLRPNLLFQLARLGGFFLFGGLLGLMGGQINITGNTVAVFTFVVSVVMFWLGLSILKIVPAISNFLPQALLKKNSRFKALKASNHAWAPLWLGALSFFLPCGFTQSMQIFALTSGSFLRGGLIMAIFALGTLPTLLILGITTTWTKKHKMLVFQKVAGILVIIFALFSFQSARTLWGVKANVISSTTESSKQPDQKNQNNTKSPSDQKEQVVNMKVTYRGFEPNVFRIKAGIPVIWNIEGVQVSGCTNKIIVPSLEITQAIKQGNNQVKFVPNKKGEIPFSCWMGMVRGKFIVE